MRAVVVTRSISHPHRFHAPFSGDAYALLLYVATPDVAPEEQSRICEEIVGSGCRFAVCYGHRCSSWDDSIDLASIKAGKDENGFVMTTWHEDETPEEVASYFWWNTAFEDFVPERMGVFIIGSDPKTEAEIECEIAKLNEPTKASSVRPEAP